MPSTTTTTTAAIKVRGPVSAEDLHTRLSVVEKHQHHHRCHHHKHLVHIDAELKQRAQDTFQDILARLERQHQKRESLLLDESSRLLHPTSHKSLHKKISSSAMRQTHGNANLRHGVEDIG
ncbi:hypothetical protein BGZ74_003195 [Mortierella antarctica]|nr:hypothetical protein BGZ74_003195 [Mortierella antarctica]KAG0352606.1 hypothetical protein BG005_007948 [Podila minutissima]